MLRVATSWTSRPCKPLALPDPQTGIALKGRSLGEGCTDWSCFPGPPPDRVKRRFNQKGKVGEVIKVTPLDPEGLDPTGVGRAQWPPNHISPLATGCQRQVRASPPMGGMTPVTAQGRRALCQRPPRPLHRRSLRPWYANFTEVGPPAGSWQILLTSPVRSLCDPTAPSKRASAHPSLLLLQRSAGRSPSSVPPPERKVRGMSCQNTDGSSMRTPYPMGVWEGNAAPLDHTTQRAL